MLNPSEPVRQHLRILGFVCFAIAGGVVGFSAVVFFLLRNGSYSPSEAVPTYLAPTLNLVALALLFIAPLLPRVFSPRPSAGSEEEIMAWHRKSVILGFALREGAAFSALVGVLTTGRQTGGFAIAGLAVVSMVMSWPRPEQLAN